MGDHRLILLVFSLVVININAQTSPDSDPNLAHLRLLESAVEKGAVCLDGSPPGYYIAKGWGSGANSWLVFLEGGAWCAAEDCLSWIKYKSTKNATADSLFYGSFNGTEVANPDFYNWNRIKVLYCDGASFMGDVDGVDPVLNITRRGMRIFHSVVEDLKASGMDKADNILFTGGSAGALAAMLHCDLFRSLVPDVRRVKCVADSGFFLSGTDKHVMGYDLREHQFDKVVAKHEVAKFLPKECTSKMNATLCMFPQNIIKYVKTPLFVIESKLDIWQMRIVDELQNFKDNATYDQWRNCTRRLQNCTAPDMHYIKGFRKMFVKTLLKKVKNIPNRGLFLHNCACHGHMTIRRLWNPSNATVENTTLQQAVGNWFFDRSPFYGVAPETEPYACFPEWPIYF